jgi:hypothetical protein
MKLSLCCFFLRCTVLLRSIYAKRKITDVSDEVKKTLLAERANNFLICNALVDGGVYRREDVSESARAARAEAVSETASTLPTTLAPGSVDFARTLSR